MGDRIEEFVNAIRTQDTHKRLKLAIELGSYLKSAIANVRDFEPLLDGLIIWAGSSNFKMETFHRNYRNTTGKEKVSSQGLELIGILALRVGPPLKGHISSMMPTIVDRLGDSKQIVRDQALDVLFKLMDPVSSPQYVFDILISSFNHKNWRVREVLMVCLTQTINRFTASSLQISRITPCLVKLLSDPTGQVRDTAVSTMVEIYRHVGEKLRSDLGRRNLPEAKLNSIFTKFDQVQKSGDMVTSTQVDGNIIAPERKKSTKSSLVRRSTSFSAGDKKKNHVMIEKTSSAAGSGAVDETDFMSAWEEVQDAKIFASREFPHELDRVNETLSNTNNDWEKRVDALKHLRSLAKISSSHVDNFPKMMKDLENALRVSVKDLRSSVVREACITLSYLASVMENKFDYIAEAMLPSLINLIPNSAKVMSTSGHATIRLIIKHTASPRLIPIIVSNLLTSKSKDIRRRCAEYMGLLLEVWDTSVLKSHVPLLEEAIRKGIADADSEARAAVRRAYWHFADHYNKRADVLMQSFDSSKQKLLQSDKNLINAGVSRPIPKYGSVKSGKPTRSASASDARDGASKKQPVRNGLMGPPAPPIERAQTHIERARTPRMTPRQKSCDDMKRHMTQRPGMREGRSRGSAKSATSQPSSRTGSPKRAVMPGFSRERSEDYMKTYSINKTRIPTPQKNPSRSASRSGSRQTSRDPSPTRTQIPGHHDTRMRTGSASAMGGSDRYVTEDALWDALQRSKGRGRERRNSLNSVNGQGSDESDTSSLSSHNQNNRQTTQDYEEILLLLQHDSTTSKRDGLVSFQSFLHGMNSMMPSEIVKIKEIFNRYFAEQNSKIYSLFLDTVSEFIVQYKYDLQDWLFVLLTRLLQRISTDILPSSQTKIARVLDVVRDSFPYDQQFQIITKYVTDNTQTPTLKMKVALLQYMLGLIGSMDASDFVNSGPIRLAVSRIITWISEPKSADVRKEAAAVIFALFQLNTPEFSAMLSNVPNSIQEGATRVIQMNLKQDAMKQPQSQTQHETMTNDYTQYSQQNKQSARSPVKPHSRHYTREEPVSTPVVRSHSRQDNLEGAETSPTSKIPIRHKLSFDGGEFHSPHSNGITPSVSTPYTHDTHYNADNSPVWLSQTKMANYNPRQYEDSLIDTRRGSHDGSFTSSDINRVADGAEQADIEENMTGSVNLVNQVFTVLSGPQNSSDSEDIKSALLELLRLIRSGSKQLVGPRMKTFLPLVLDLLKHKEATIRCLAARALREIAASHPDTYKRDLQAFILPLLETEADSQKEVAKTAEECCSLVSQNLHPNEVFPVVAPLAGVAEYPTNVSAIKMLQSVVATCDAHTMTSNLNTVVPNLLKAYDHPESSARKAAVFCLVAIHNIAGGENVNPYFKQLAGSKMKLLNLYIRRSQSTNV